MAAGGELVPFTGSVSRIRPLPFTVAAAGELSVTYSGNGAGVGVAVKIGPVPDPVTQEVTPLTLATHQALSQIVQANLERLRVDVQMILDMAQGGAQ